MSLPVRAKLERLLLSRLAEWTVTGAIIANAVVLGLETYAAVTERIGGLLLFLDRFFLWFFTFEIAARLYVSGWRFFRGAWNLFDFSVVAISWVAAGPFATLRALRVLRVLRLISTVPSIRQVVSGLLQAIPGVGAIMALLLLVFYVFSVIATQLYGQAFPEWFGSLGRSAYTLFQIMTLESWSMGIVRPVMKEFPFAWMFFVPFILVTSFTVLNLFIGIIVNAMQVEHEAEMKAEQEVRDRAVHQILEELRNLRAEVRALRERQESDERKT